MSPTPWNDARSRLLAAGLVPAGMIEFPNEPFQEPDASTGAAWLSVEAVGDILSPIEMGGGGWQEEGRLFVHVMVPAFSGSDAARTLAKAVANVYRFSGPNPTRYNGASIGGGEKANVEGTLWRLTVILDWKFQDTAAG